MSFSISFRIFSPNSGITGVSNKYCMFSFFRVKVELSIMVSLIYFTDLLCFGYTVKEGLLSYFINNNSLLVNTIYC